MTYQERIKQIAAQSLGSPAQVWLTEYLKFRGSCLLVELRRSTPETLEKIQGKLDENDKLMELITAIEESKLE